MPDRLLAPPSIPIKEIDFTQGNETKLNCGNVIYCSPKRDFGVLKLDIYWPEGTAVQSKPAQARAALQLLFGGTQNRTAEQILDGFESHGASFSCNTGLLGSSISVKTISANLVYILPVLIDVLENACFPQNEINLFKTVEVSSLQRKMQTPGYWSQRLCLESLYGESTPETMFSNPEHIEDLTHQNLFDYTKNHLAGNNAMLFVSGDYNDHTISLIDNSFLALTTKQLNQTNTPTTKPNKPTQSITKHLPHSNQISLCMAKNFDRVSHTMFPQLSLLNLFLGGFFGSRLMQDLREEKGLTYGIGSNISLSCTGHTWMITGEMNNQNAELTQSCIREILNGLSSNPPMGEELEKAKLYYGGQLRGSMDGPFSEPGRIQFLLKTGYPHDYYKTVLNTVWETKTDTLAELAYNYLQPDSFTIALAGATGISN